MLSPKPLVQVACVCEKVLIERDDVPSLIRIVDTYNLRVPPDAPLPPGAAVDLTAFISVKSGEVVGAVEIGLRLKDPDGELQPPRKWPVVLNGGEHGANLTIAFALLRPKSGLYWFDVLWREEVLTSIPFRLKYARPTAERDEPSATESH
jgi:hypothetical protein